MNLPITKDQTILINRVRAYERQIAARAKALAAAEKANPIADIVFNKRYVLPFIYQTGDLQPQTKVLTVDRDVTWFLCMETAFSLTETGTNGTSEVSWTMNPRFRPGQRSGSVLIRDSFRDRAWSNRPLPDGFFGNGNFGPRRLPRPAKLPGGTSISVTYTPLSEFGAVTPLLGAAKNFTFLFSFIGAEVRVPDAAIERGDL